MDCGRTSTNLPSGEQLPVIRGRLSRICESDDVLPNSGVGANSRTAEFQHSHLGDIAQKRAMLTNSRIRVGEHRRIAISATSSGRTPPKEPDRPELPDSNGKHHSAVRSTQISPPAPPASRTAYRNASSCESEVGWPYCRRPQAAPRPPTAAPPQDRGSGSVRAADSTRRTPAATPIRQPPGRAYRQPGTTSHTRTQRMQSQAHR